MIPAKINIPVRDGPSGHGVWFHGVQKGKRGSAAGNGPLPELNTCNRGAWAAIPALDPRKHRQGDQNGKAGYGNAAKSLAPGTVFY